MLYELRLNCNDCGAFNEYHRIDGDPRTVVRCDVCGKRHSNDSVWMVNIRKDYDRDEAGNLLEEPI
jgi:uncharacterized Zn finger protein